MTIHIGTSGWSYDHWQGVLYPADLPQRERLAQYVRHFATVEVNSTYYHWPPSTTFASWRQRTPDHFVLTAKAPRGLTHGARLYAPERWLARVGQDMAALGGKRGVLLLQTPPDMPYDHIRLAYALEHVPPGLRVALEFRHPSWHHEATFALLERYGAAYCIMSGAGLPCELRATAPFVYARLHGPDPHSLYAGSYSDDSLGWWAERVREWDRQGRDVFAYFNNDGYGNAVRNALALKAMLGV